jgi:oligopeptidase A
MAKTGRTALAFIDDLHAQFLEDDASLRAYVSEQTGAAVTTISPWNRPFWSEHRKRSLFNFDEESLRPYFSVDAVLEGLFKIASTLYGLRVEEAPIDVYSPDVRFFRVVDAASGTERGRLYADLSARPGKRPGAWEMPLEFGRGEAHVVIIAATFPRPIGGRPALIDHDEVVTVFHEFGHACHTMVDEGPFDRTASSSVAWDFVELPSQFLENWAWDRAELDIFARNEAGEGIPDDLFRGMQRARTYNTGLAMMRQLALAKLDLELHLNYERWVGRPIDDIDREILERYKIPGSPQVPSSAHNFCHAFASPVGYAAGYYSYYWAEVLDADAFTAFQKEGGILNAELGGRFRREILAKGATEPPDVLFRNFLGRDPDPTAFLRRNGVRTAAGKAE